MKTRKLIDKIAEKGKASDMDKLSDLLVCAIENSEDPYCYQMKLYVILNGYHFDKETLAYALDMIGGMKLTCDEVSNKLKLYGIQIPEDVAIEDVSYALHMFYSDYSELNLNEQQALKWSVLYVTDNDYPIRNGKAFAEWSYKMKLLKEHK